MPIEFQILDMIQSIRNPVLDLIMVCITNLGEAGIVWIITGITLLFFPQTRKSGAVVLVALFFEVLLCNGLLKNIFQRIRPCDVKTSIELLVARPHDFSFPSGHTAASFAAAFALLFSGRKVLCVPAFILACLIAFSRLYLYVHFPTDILGGIFVGALCAWLSWKGWKVAI